MLENFLGSICVVLFLFILKEVLRPKKNLTGEWEVKNMGLDTGYKPYMELTVVWQMHILQNENTITGSGEKIKDIKLSGEIVEYDPDKRDTVELQGYVEKNYLRKSRIFINVIQVGRLRRSRATYVLELINDSTLVGTYVTTAGNTKGSSTFSKNAQDI